MLKTTTLWAEHALTETGWQSGVRVVIDAKGQIESVLEDRDAWPRPTGFVLELAQANVSVSGEPDS